MEYSECIARLRAPLAGLLRRTEIPPVRYRHSAATSGAVSTVLKILHELAHGLTDNAQYRGQPAGTPEVSGFSDWPSYVGVAMQDQLTFARIQVRNCAQLGKPTQSALSNVPWCVKSQNAKSAWVTLQTFERNEPA